jgi:hypothetical protein
MEIVHTSWGRAAENMFDLSVELRGDAVHVGAGTTVLRGARHAFGGETIPIQRRSYDTSVIGYLVIDTDTGELVVFVDEHVQDGIDMPYIFGRDDRYRLEAHLFSFVVPANVIDLTSLDYNRWRILASSESI